MLRNPTIPRPLSLLPALVVAVLLVVPAGPASAELRDVTIAFEPEVPSWQDPVTVTVRGESNCLARIHDASTAFDSEIGVLIRIEIEEGCTLDPPLFVPFEDTAELGRLTPREYPVHITPPDEPQTVLVEGSFSVLDHADVLISPPAEAPTDAAPFTFTVTVFDSTCLAPSLREVSDGVILVDYPVQCPILPPGPSVFDAQLEVGPLAAGDYEIRVVRDPFEQPDRIARSSVRVYDADLCVPSDTTLCLNDDRFRVAVEWMDFQGGTGAGRAIPERDDTGLFWFFDEDNVELTVKVLDGCGVNGHYWVFVSSGSTVEYEITVTDTLRDETRTYDNELGDTPSLIANTNAFATCP